MSVTDLIEELRTMPGYLSVIDNYGYFIVGVELRKNSNSENVICLIREPVSALGRKSK